MVAVTRNVESSFLWDPLTLDSMIKKFSTSTLALENRDCNCDPEPKIGLKLQDLCDSVLDDVQREMLKNLKLKIPTS